MKSVPRARLHAAILASCWLGATASLRAQSESTEIRVASLIRRLGSESFDERNLANEALARLGPEARRELETATRHDDPEVRLRAKDLLLRLKVADLWTAAPVRCPNGKCPASKLLAAVAEQSGNRVLMGDQYGSFHEQELSLGSARGSFWEIVDEVCRQTGNRVRPHYDTRQPGLVVVAGGPTKFPVSYCGPLRAQITGARRVFSEELDYEDLSSDLSHTFQFNLQMMWEDRFKLVAYRAQPEVVLAKTDAGNELPPTQPSGAGWNVAGAGTRQLTMSLRLHPPTTAARQLDTLRLRWGLIAVGDMAALEVSDLSSTEPHFQDDVELVVESVQTGPGARVEISLLLVRDLVVPDPQEVLFQENDVELIGHDGKPFRKQGQTNSVGEAGAKIKVTFTGETSESVPKTLRFVYPRVRAQKDVEIVFRHVPLPVGRPE